MKKEFIFEISSTQLSRALSQAFEKGKDWAKTYISWFDPRKSQHTYYRRKAREEIITRLIKDGMKIKEGKN